MDFSTVTSEHFIGGLIGLGLLVKGFARFKTKEADRGCLGGDSAHEKLLERMDACAAQLAHNNRLLIEMCTMMRCDYRRGGDHD